MKNNIAFSIGIFFLLIQVHVKSAPTVYNQLCEVNSEWAKNKIHFPFINESFLLKTEQELIELHLSLVEITLRNKNVSHLSLVQQEKRGECLDVLHDYWKRGIFPINLNHIERTPYFIDHLGTPCAVGHILIKSGCTEFANQIHVENNYGYIFDLSKQYSLLYDWATVHGFSLEELAWIQPSYSCWSSSGGAYSPTCPGYNDGYIYLEVPVGGTPPYSVSGPPCWSLMAGNYEYTITDAVGNVYVQSYTLVDPAPIGVVANWVSDATSPSTCDGVATASASGGSGTLSYFWNDCSGGALLGNSQTISALCPGDYKVLVNDSYGCSEVSSCIAISNLAGVEENSTDFSYSIFPNPTSESITITLSKTIPNSFIELTDIFGRIILHVDAEKNNVIELCDFDLESGCYFVRIENNGDSHVEKIVFIR